MTLTIGTESNKLTIFSKINIEVCKSFHSDCHGSKTKPLHKLFVPSVELILIRELICTIKIDSILFLVEGFMKCARVNKKT